MAESKRDYCEVLGVPKDADEDTLKETHKKLAKRYHPDVSSDSKAAEAKFKEVSEVYSVLSDPRKRQQYGQFGHAAFEQGRTGAGDFGGGFGGFDLGRDAGDTFGDISGGIFDGGRSGRARNGPSRGANIKTSVRTMSGGTVFGYDKEIEINSKEACANCHGTGTKAGTPPQTCSKCNGKGKTMYTQ